MGLPAVIEQPDQTGERESQHPEIAVHRPDHTPDEHHGHQHG